MSGLCSVCRGPLALGPGWWRCAGNPGHPAGAILPTPARGELWSSGGTAWGRLDSLKHGTDVGWRSSYRTRSE